MKTTFSDADLKLFESKLNSQSEKNSAPGNRHPVHVVYGGAHLFKAGTMRKFGQIALDSIENYAENFAEFAAAMWLEGAETLPKYRELIEDMEFRLTDDPEKVKKENFPAWFAHTIYRKTIEKLQREPVEDFRIDFEDGYGIRSDAEEDAHAISASGELAKGFLENSLPAFTGFRIKSFAPETRNRAFRTLDLFLSNLLERTSGKLPAGFVVALPKVTRKEETEILAELLSEFEKKNDLPEKSLKLEIVIETPQAFINERGEIALREIVEAAQGRCVAAHFGAYDYTASFGISGAYQHLGHEACNFARQLMQVALAPLSIRLSDSVTTEMPVPVFRGENLTKDELEANKTAVRRAWRRHFSNVTDSLINGFYQSWDLHPAQLAPRYAAVYAFFLKSKDEQAKRLRGFLEKATKALLTGNQFDDAASAQGLLNFFIRAQTCGAMSAVEIGRETGLTPEELNSASFVKIMENRRGEKL